MVVSWLRIAFCFCYAWSCLMICRAGLGEELREGDRVVFLGATFIERMQTCEQVETYLTAGQPGVTFRNLGWSGDNVFGEARALFGSRDDGFRRLEADLKATQPTVVLVAYGANEAHAGEAGLEPFTQGLQRLLDSLQGTGARITILLPAPYEQVGPPFPDPTPFNKQLEAYRQRLRQAAEQRKLNVIDLAELFEAARQASPTGTLTNNGLHLQGDGYRRLAPHLAAALGVTTPAWYVDFDPQQSILEAQGCLVEREPTSRPQQAANPAARPAPPAASTPPAKPQEAAPAAVISLRIIDHVLPPPQVPHVAPTSVGTLRLRGLPAGNYELRVDDQPLLTASAEQWYEGVRLTERGGTKRANELRQTIVEKNLLYLHRYRPQNETYLFLFRKHEQGNNAVEIPQFDPLVATLEKRIAELRIPQSHRYQWIRVSQEASAGRP